MQWIAPTEKDSGTTSLEKKLWDAADQFRANSGLKAQEYSGPILGLIFLRFAEVRFAMQRSKLEKGGASPRRGNRAEDPAAYHADGIIYLSPEARYDFLLTFAYSKPNQSTIPKQTSPPFQSKPVQHSEANQSTCFRLNI